MAFTTMEQEAARQVYMNVGGTKRPVDASVVRLAPLGSRARALLSQTKTPHDEWFVDERPGHFGRMIDCLRHGPSAVDFMKPYHAAIVQSLLGALSPDDQHDDLVNPSTCESFMVKDDQGPHPRCDNDGGTDNVDNLGDDDTAVDGRRSPVMRLLLDDGTRMDVARSTLQRIPARSESTSKSSLQQQSPPRQCHKFRRCDDSVLARIASGDPQWRPPTIDGRFYIAQNARHFGLLLDCLRHGTDIIAHITSLYKLWGLRTIAIYYGLDAIADATHIAIGRRRYDAEPERKLEIEVLDRTLFPRTNGTEWHVVSYGHRYGKIVRASNRMSHDDIAALARAAIGAPGHVGVFADPCVDGWRRLDADDTMPYGQRKRLGFSDRGFSRVYVDDHPADGCDRATARDDAPNGPGLLDVCDKSDQLRSNNNTDSVAIGNDAAVHQDIDSQHVPEWRYALVIVFDMLQEQARNFGILAFDISNETANAGDAIIQACMRRDPSASAWKHVVAITRASYDHYSRIDTRHPLPYNVCGGGTIWIAHGKPGLTQHDVVQLDVPIDPLYL